MENWRDVRGYEGLDQVSNYGGVKSITHYDSMGRTKKGCILVPSLDSRKHYLKVSFYKKGIHKNAYIHKLVANAFLPNLNRFPVVNHKDENKLNNNASNLEWCTYQYNNTYGKMKNIRLGESNGCSKITYDIAIYIKQHHVPNDKVYGTTALSKKFGISAPQVSAIAHGKRWAWI